MNDDIFSVDLLGKLEIDEIFYYYEEPQLFTCVSKFGQKYLGMLIDIDEREWLMVPVSSSRLALLKSNKICVRDAFTEAEDEFVWRLVSENRKIKAQQVFLNDIDEKDLPDDDLYLDCEDEYMPTYNDDILKTSIEEKRDIMDISILPSNKHIRELEFQVLGETLVNIQQVLYALALERDNNGNRISNKIKEENTLSVTGTYAASFGIRAKSNKLSDLYDETPVTKNLKRLSELLYAKDDENKLKKLLKDMNPRVSIRYKKLMECLFKEKLAFNVTFASPNKYSFKAEFTEEDIEKNLIYLSESVDNIITTEEIGGKLVGINVSKKKFAFETFEGEMITGTIAEELIERITFKVPIEARIIMEKETMLSGLTDDERYKYKLTNIKMVSG